MCGIYGVLSYKDKLKDMNELVDLLSMESAERGTDATGVAYSILGNMKINKSAVSAYKFNPNIPKFVNAVIGHTRHSTQGDKSKNYNNHPWSERVKNCQFALAHNGVLFNDKELQKKYNFKSKIETDSFVAVQLLKYKNALNFKTIKFMAESIEGSFSFNILDNQNNLYLVKGTPLLLQLFFFYFGLTYVTLPNGESITLSMFTAAVISFVLNYAAYFAEIFRGGIIGVSKGQYEASKALGLTGIQTMRYVIVPQMIRTVIPPIANETIVLVKDTALASSIALINLLKAAQRAVNRDMRVSPYLVAALFYLVITLILTFGFNYVEKRLSISEQGVK